MGSNSSKGKSVSERPTVVIVGAGYAGTSVAKPLDKIANVILIEKKNYMHHTIGSLRAVVAAGWAYRTALPLDKLLVDGTVVQGSVTSITPESVSGEDGRSARFDYLVIACGRSQHAPCMGSNDAAGFVDAIEGLREEVSVAKSVLVLGGGAVGVELCAELKTAHPECAVTLLSSSSKLCNPALPDKFHTRAAKKLKKMGVELVLGERAVLPEEAKHDPWWVGRKITVATESGDYQLNADLVFMCTGTQPNAESYEAAFASVLDDRKRLKVLGTQQVEGQQNVFAVGDCCCTPNNDWEMAFHAKKQAEVVASNIAAMIKARSLGREPSLKSGYGFSGKVAMLVTLGAKDGVGQLPFGAAPTALVRTMKSQ